MATSTLFLGMLENQKTLFFTFRKPVKNSTIFSMKGHSVTSLGFQWNISGTIVRQLSAGKDAEISELSLLLFHQDFPPFSVKHFLDALASLAFKLSVSE